MRVLTVFAHHNSRSFCHAVLDRFDAGLKDSGQTNEIVDLYGIGRLLRERYQAKDVLAQQAKVARAEGLAFVAPVHFLSFPAILKG